MVLVMIVPLLVGLRLLAEPTVRILFERGQFTAADTAQVVMALHVYLVGALFAAIDFPLIYAFYARNNTLLPALVGVLSVLVYGAVALALIEGIGFLGLVWADTAKQAAHAVVMLGLLYWKVRPLNRQGQSNNASEGLAERSSLEIEPTTRSVAAVIGSATAMVLVMAWLLSLLDTSGATSLKNDLVQLLVGGGSGALVYAGSLLLAGQPEARQLCRAALRLGGLARSE